MTPNRYMTLRFREVREEATRKTTEDEERIMETSAFTDSHVSVPSSKSYERAIQSLEAALGEIDARSFVEIVGTSGL